MWGVVEAFKGLSLAFAEDPSVPRSMRSDEFVAQANQTLAAIA